MKKAIDLQLREMKDRTRDRLQQDWTQKSQNESDFNPSATAGNQQETKSTSVM